MRALRGILGRLALLSFAVLFSLALAEGSFCLLLSRPALIESLPRNVLSHLRAYYLHHDRSLVQAMPECARYDPGLFYTLKPGACRSQAREFDVEIRVNSAGLRDDAESLVAPDVIVAGDSFAMGWGVGQDEAFPQQVEKQSGLRVLNAGIPSFGSVREMRLLDRLDVSRLRYLLIQYDDNDEPENAEFLRRDNELRIKSEAVYVADVQHNASRHAYWPGKATFEILKGVVYPEPLPKAAEVTPREEARFFVNALLHATRVDLSKVQLVVFELDPYGVGRSEFEMSLLGEIALEVHKPFVRGMRVLDFRGKLGPEDYYVLDDHLRAQGHAKVAQLLTDELKRAPHP